MSALPPDVPPHFQTFLAFDYGLKRTGVAVGNRLLRTATPQPTIRAEGDARLVQAALRVKEWQPDALVDGDVARHEQRDDDHADDCCEWHSMTSKLSHRAHRDSFSVRDAIALFSRSIFAIGVGSTPASTAR